MKDKIGLILFVIFCCIFISQIIYLRLPRKPINFKRVYIIDTLNNDTIFMELKGFLDTIHIASVDTFYVTEVDSFCVTADCNHIKR